MKEKKIKEIFGVNNKFISELTARELFKALLELESFNYPNVFEQDVTICIGSSKSGTSTLLNLLLGNELISKFKVGKFDRHYVLDLKNEDIEAIYPKIGHGIESETTIPVKYVAQNGKIYFDWPSFGGGIAQQEIINSWILKEIVATAKGIKFVVCWPDQSLDSSGFINYVNNLINIFGKENLSNIKPVLVFTKAKHSLEEFNKILLSFTEKYFNNDLAVRKFITQAKIAKIDKPQEDNTEINAENLQDALNESGYHKISLNHAHPICLETFLYNSFSDLEKFISGNILESYKKNSQENKLSQKLVDLFKECKSTNVSSALKEYLDASNKLKMLPIDILDEKTKNATKKIVDFVSSILKKDSGNMQNFDEAMRLYSLSSISKDAISHFIEFLKSKLTNPNYKDKLAKVLAHEMSLIKNQEVDLLLTHEEIRKKLDSNISHSEEIDDLLKNSESIKQELVSQDSLIKHISATMISLMITRLIAGSIFSSTTLLGIPLYLAVKKTFDEFQNDSSDYDKLNICFADYLKTHPLNNEILGEIKIESEKDDSFELMLCNN